jgi:DNA-binding HxlR family transcriptional regulator
MKLSTDMTSEQFERMNCMSETDKSKVNDFLTLLSKSKMLSIIYILSCEAKPIRFSELKARVDSSSTTVSRRLRELEHYELVTRKVFPTVPTTVEYKLTEAAISLKPSLEALFEWVLDNADSSI